MKKVFKIVAVAICLEVAVGSHQASAQKVYASGGKVYIDCGPGTGFPQGAVTTVSKIQAGTPTNDAFFPSEAVNGSNGTINATVYRRFEVAKADIPTNPGWAAAYIYCRETYSDTGGGGGWRLPTQRIIGKTKSVRFADRKVLKIFEIPTSSQKRPKDQQTIFGLVFCQNIPHLL